MHLECAFILHGDITRTDWKLVEIINDVRAKKKKKKKKEKKKKKPAFLTCFASKAARGGKCPQLQLVKNFPDGWFRLHTGTGPLWSLSPLLPPLLLSGESSLILAPPASASPPQPARFLYSRSPHWRHARTGAARWPITESAGSKDRLRST